MYGNRGAMFGSGGLSDGYGLGSKRPRMMESTPYVTVRSISTTQPPHGYSFPVVRLRGLPFSCAETQIFQFFAGLDIVDVFLVNKEGRFSGEAFVVFAGPVQSDLALQRDRQVMGRRYVEVFRCKKSEYYRAVAAEVSESNVDFRPLSPPRRRKSPEKNLSEYTEVLKMRGVPYSITKEDIVEFFGGFGVVEGRIVIPLRRSDGRATGEAFVEFVSAEEARKAAVGRDKKMIGSRYVELFPSTPDEARRAAMKPCK